MGAGNMDQGTTLGLTDLQHIHPDHLTLGIGFAGDLLRRTHHGIGCLVALADPDKNIAVGIDPQDGGGQQLLGLIGIAFIDHATLSLPDALDQHLLKGLGSDAAELIHIHGNAELIAQLHIGLNILGCIDMDFQRGILYFLHHGLDHVDIQALLAEINNNIIRRYIPAILTILPVGIGHTLLHTLHHIVHGDTLGLFQVPQGCEDLRAQVYLGSLGIFLCSCHLIFSSNIKFLQCI